MLERVMMIIVQLPNGTALTGEIEPSNTIGHLKRQILNQLNLGNHPDWRLSWGYEKLDDHRTFADYNITRDELFPIVLSNSNLSVLKYYCSLFLTPFAFWRRQNPVQLNTIIVPSVPLAQEVVPAVQNFVPAHSVENDDAAISENNNRTLHPPTIS